MGERSASSRRALAGLLLIDGSFGLLIERAIRSPASKLMEDPAENPSLSGRSEESTREHCCVSAGITPDRRSDSRTHNLIVREHRRRHEAQPARRHDGGAGNRRPCGVVHSQPRRMTTHP